MFCGRPECEATFRRGEGESDHTRKTRTNSSFNLHKDIKNKLECIMTGGGENEGPQTPIK